MLTRAVGTLLACGRQISPSPGGPTWRSNGYTRLECSTLSLHADAGPAPSDHLQALPFVRSKPVVGVCIVRNRTYGPAALYSPWRQIGVEQMKVCGACLCRAVTYEVEVPAKRFVYCHCSRCRKATGTAHATNLIVEAPAFRWLSGSDKVARFDLPTAKSFATSFCTVCGSPLPHPTRSGREVIVPAGSLDDNPQSTPEAHISWSSRAPWYEHGDRVPISEDLNPTNLPSMGSVG